MAIEKILVEEFDVLKNGDQYAIAFDVDDGPIFDADFMYDGRNCAILTRNNKKAFLLTNIVPDARKVLNKLNSIVIIERTKGEVSNVYEVDLRHVDNIPYPDNLQEDVDKMLDELKAELGEEEFTELMKSIAEEYKKSKK